MVMQRLPNRWAECLHELREECLVEEKCTTCIGMRGKEIIIWRFMDKRIVSGFSGYILVGPS